MATANETLTQRKAEAEQAADRAVATYTDAEIFASARDAERALHGLHIKVRAGLEADVWLSLRGWRAAALREAYISRWLAAYHRRAQALLDADPAYRAEQKAARLRNLVDGFLREADSDLSKFAERLAQDAAYAFEWGDAAATAAARRRVALEMQEVIAFDGPQGGVDAAVAVARREALRGARYPSHSTSVLSNLMKQEITAAYAEIANHMEGL